MVARGRLTADGIESAALALIEAEGVDGFSFRGLSKHLACEPMSLYHHYPSKAALMEALVDRVMGELRAPQPAGPWRERLTQMAHDFRAMAWRRPAFFQFLALHRLNTAGGLRWLDGALAAFREAGLDEEAAARLFRVFGYYITGSALDETSGYGRGPSAVNPPDAAEIARLYPAVAAAAPWFAPNQMDTTFDMGLDLLLDGVAARLRA
ncbi:TetR/AcrR family transcriptional regulator [Phenylobacterium sp.]|uniref:TetR/AcrR family transcriptional regulator n=1 Tax=Phenylobacterium sp. TaxID=1871053 RepID=UPI002FC750C7